MLGSSRRPSPGKLCCCYYLAPVFIFKLYHRRRNQTEILKLLWTFTPTQHRMISQESQLARQAARQGGPFCSLVRLSRDAVMMRLTENTQERQVKPLVDRLEMEEGSMYHNIKATMEVTYSGGSIIDNHYLLIKCLTYQYFRALWSLRFSHFYHVEARTQGLFSSDQDCLKSGHRRMRNFS